MVKSIKEFAKRSAVIMNFTNILGNDSLFGRIFGKIGDIIFLNVLFIIFCLPIITIGASYTAMEYTFMKQLKEFDTPIFKTFIRAFKSNFKQSTVSWIILLVLGMIVGVDLNTFGPGGVLSFRPFYYLFMLAAIVLGFMCLYIFPVIGVFENSLKNLWIQAFFLAAKNVPFTLLMCVLVIAPFYLTISSGMYFLLFLTFWIVFGFGLVGYLLAFILYHIFTPYLA
jgi:uncharacterized membrane protein YesL